MKKLIKNLIFVLIINLGIFAQPEPMRIIDGKDAGLVLQRVPEVWAEGYFGQGVLIASIDEDFNWDHPDIVNQIWNNDGEDYDDDGHTIEFNGTRWVLDPGDLNGIDDDNNGYVDDLIGWNFVNNNNIVTRNDATSHGTQVAGVLVGDGTNEIKTGIAPQAELMLLRIGTNGEQEQYFAWEAMQYCIDMGVDIISQSQSFHWDDTWCDENGQNCGPPDVAKFREMAVLELQAGIIHFSSIGNDGELVNGNDVPIPFNVSVPGNCPPPWLHPDQTLVEGLTAMMGIGNLDASHDDIRIHRTSPYGPSSQEDYTWFWDGTGGHLEALPMPAEYQDYPYNDGSMGLLKPDLTAYGNNTHSINGTYPNFIYKKFSGTSSATPHAAGVAALLLSVNPLLTPAQICEVLKTTAIDAGDPGHDNRYGAGAVDAYEAYLEVISGLPVELSSFTATLKDHTVILEWRTETETNNFGFDVERTSSLTTPALTNWETIGFVAGNGNSNSIKQYSFTDKNLVGGTIFQYRLKQIDNDGTFEYSDVVTVTVGIPVLFALSQNYPNPFNPNTTIYYSVPGKALVIIDIYDVLGNEVATLINEEKREGRYEVMFNANGFSSGIYYYRMRANDFIDVKKMILLK